LRLRGAKRGWKAVLDHAEHGGVFENRIEDRKPLRVLFSVLGRWMEFRRRIDQNIFSKLTRVGMEMRVQNET
jgi:hypothetical protein